MGCRLARDGRHHDAPGVTRGVNALVDGAVPAASVDGHVDAAVAGLLEHLCHRIDG
jgi:hypothetical protein